MEAAPVENSLSASPPSNTDHHPANSVPDPSNTDHHPANSVPDPSNTGHHPANSVPDPQNDREMEPNHEISAEEATSIMEVIAATGKFWHDWDMLKGLVASRLKQVLAEYPEAQTVNDMIGPQQSCLLGETYPELVKRLDEALLSFVEGPPFTLQRLCEILLNPRSIYPNLSKLALALEKNLLVTSTLTMSTDPYPLSTSHKGVEPEKGSDKPEAQPNPTENGTEAMSNGDEEMVDAEVEEDKIHEIKNEEMETSKETANDATKTSPEPVTTSETADPYLPTEHLNHTSS